MECLALLLPGMAMSMLRSGESESQKAMTGMLAKDACKERKERGRSAQEEAKVWVYRRRGRGGSPLPLSPHSRPAAPALRRTSRMGWWSTRGSVTISRRGSRYCFVIWLVKVPGV